MPKGKKRLTQREKAERAAIKKQLQADGVLPPDKPRLNRKKFAREVWDEFSEMDVYTADFYLRKAIMATVGPELHEVTSEQVGILKLMKLAVETDRFMRQLKTEGREQYSIGEYRGDQQHAEQGCTHPVPAAVREEWLHQIQQETQDTAKADDRVPDGQERRCAGRPPDGGQAGA